MQLQQALFTGQVRAVHIETLEVNGPATRALRSQPGHLVLGVELMDGTFIEHVPAQLRDARRMRLAAGVMTCVAGGVGLLLGYAWLGALALVVGTHACRTAGLVPHRPFSVCRQVT